MEKLFEKHTVEARMLDFAEGFAEKAIPVELRKDYFTDRVSRVLKFRMRFPEASHEPELIEASRKNCPFCAENLERLTPKFPADLVSEGRICFGRSTVLPNAFPYSRYCGVTVISDEHYISLDRFSVEKLFSAFKASTLFIERINANARNVSYASINWNYMPGSGGGLIHPHIQVVVSRRPTHFHERLMRSSADYKTAHGRNYWADLIEFEKQNNIRYLFDYGGIEFISLFSPSGMFGEILAIFKGMSSIRDLTDETWESYAQGLTRLLKCFHRMHLNNLNMTLLISLEANDSCWIQSRIMPRVTLPPLRTSDVNYFEKGHDEVIVIVSPEDLAEEIRLTG
jgi:UDPglucose--hexose-1-phosphate uridylyltransferase